jgi:hypothetical protein
VPERPSSTGNWPKGPARTPSRKPPKDLDPQVLTIAPDGNPDYLQWIADETGAAVGSSGDQRHADER